MPKRKSRRPEKRKSTKRRTKKKPDFVNVFTDKIDVVYFRKGDDIGRTKKFKTMSGAMKSIKKFLGKKKIRLITIIIRFKIPRTINQDSI